MKRRRGLDLYRDRRAVTYRGLCFFEGEAAGGGSGGTAAGGAGTQGAPAPQQQPTNITGAQPAPQQPSSGAQADDFLTAVGSVGLQGGAVEGFRNLVAQRGSPLAAAAFLYDENYRLRTKGELTPEQMQRTLTDKGFLVLTAEQAKVHNAYTQLGKPEEITEQRTRLSALETEKATREYNERLDGIAKIHDLKPSLFKMLVAANRLDVQTEEVEVEVQGTGEKKKEERAFVVTERDKDKKVVKSVPLDDYLKKHHAEDYDTLHAGEGTRTDSTSQQTSGGGQWMQQPSTQSRGGQNNPASNYINSTYVQPAAKQAGK